MPGRRSVYEGTYEGRPVIIKVFSSRLHGQRHFKREVKGLELLAQRNIPAPRLVMTGRNRDGWILVVEKIEPAEDVLTVYNRMSEPTETCSILKPVFKQLAAMHTAGVLQKDLHLGNFLWDGETLYAMDPAQMRFESEPINSSQSYCQLGNLATMFWGYDRSLKTELFDVYFKARGWTLNNSAFDQIEKFAATARAHGLEHTLKKSLRTCTDFVRHTSATKSGVYDRSVFEGQDLTAFMEKIDDIMENGKILKRGNSSLVSRIELNGHDTVVKRYNHKGHLHSLRHTIKGSRAKKCWLLGHRLCRLDIPTAKPLAFIEQRKNGFLYQSCLITEYVEGQTLYQLLKDAEASDPSAKTALEQSNQLIQKLVDNGLTHADLKLSNILFTKTGPVLIDLDSMHRHRMHFILDFYAKKMITKFHRRLEDI